MRIANYAVALGLLEAFASAGGKAAAAPSANRFGNVPPTTAQAVMDEPGNYMSAAGQILDGVACEVGAAAKIIECTTDSPKILRPGAVRGKMIRDSTGIAHANFGEVIEEVNLICVSGSLGPTTRP